jgi:hypothetical protein
LQRIHAPVALAQVHWSITLPNMPQNSIAHVMCAYLNEEVAHPEMHMQGIAQGQANLPRCLPFDLYAVSYLHDGTLCSGDTFLASRLQAVCIAKKALLAHSSYHAWSRVKQQCQVERVLEAITNALGAKSQLLAASERHA